MTRLAPLTCAAAQQRLQAYHDLELSIRDQIAVSAHLEWCDGCAAALGELRAMQSALLTRAHDRPLLSNEEAAVFAAGVVNRLKAEQAASLLASVRDMFDDIRLVYAGLGAAAATIMFMAITLGMIRFATHERPDSLAAIVSLLASPVECETGADFANVSGCRERWEARFQRATESAEQDSVFTLAAVVTHRSGRLTSLQSLRTSSRQTDADAETVEALLDSVSRSRLEGAPGIRMPINVLWIVEHATVRAAKQPPLVEPLTRKKRAASGPLPVLQPSVLV